MNDHALALLAAWERQLRATHRLLSTTVDIAAHVKQDGDKDDNAQWEYIVKSAVKEWIAQYNSVITSSQFVKLLLTYNKRGATLVGSDRAKALMDESDEFTPALDMMKAGLTEKVRADAVAAIFLVDSTKETGKEIH